MDCLLELPSGGQSAALALAGFNGIFRCSIDLGRKRPAGWCRFGIFQRTKSIFVDEVLGKPGWRVEMSTSMKHNKILTNYINTFCCSYFWRNEQKHQNRTFYSTVDEVDVKSTSQLLAVVMRMLSGNHPRSLQEMLPAVLQENQTLLKKFLQGFLLKVFNRLLKKFFQRFYWIFPWIFPQKFLVRFLHKLG